MSVAFDREDWARVRENYSKWWENKLDRPLIPVRMTGRDPGRPQPYAPLLWQNNCDRLDIPAKDVIDRLDHELSRFEFLGDAFPYVNFDSFGPGVIAAFLGATLDNSTGGVWFHPKEILPIEELHFEYDPNNIWLKRIKELYEAGLEYWQGRVIMGMPDLGGVMDILSTFRPSENLLLDLYDDPDEVKRVVWEIHELWMKFYNELNDILQPVNPGYFDWAQIYSDKPSYVVQSDFSYMISPAFFDEFVKPELACMCRKIGRSIYHLDGVGELNHLDSILEIEDINAVQWIPGDGQKPQVEWPEVLTNIHKAGKLVQLNGSLPDLDRVVEYLGTTKGIHVMRQDALPEQRQEYLRYLEKYQVI